MPRTESPAPGFFDTARAFYADAFDHKSKRYLAYSIAEWGEMEEAEQSFIVAHLLYLNLRAQASGQRLLTQIRDALDDVADLVAEPPDDLPPEPGDVDPDPAPPDVDSAPDRFRVAPVPDRALDVTPAADVPTPDVTADTDARPVIDVEEVTP